MLLGDATDDRLSIGDDPMNPRQEVARSFGITKHNPTVLKILSLRRLSKRSPSIAPYHFQDLLTLYGCGSAAESVQKAFNTFRGSILYHSHMRKARSFSAFRVSIKRHRTQNGSLPLTSSSSYLTSRPKKGIIHLYQTNQAISSISISHGFSDLVSHEPCGLVILDIQNTLHFGNRHADLIHCHMVDQPVPPDKRGVRVL